MGCCGQRRREAAAWPSVTPRVAPAPAPGAGDIVRLKYHGDAPAIFTGPVTGTRYAIERTPGEVDARDADAPALIATGRFKRVADD